MAKFDLKFLDANDKSTIRVFQNEGRTTLRVVVYGEWSDSEVEIDLDKSTAIKFAKTLRTEINKIVDFDVKYVPKDNVSNEYVLSDWSEHDIFKSK